LGWVEYASAASLEPFIRESVEPGATVFTDARGGYNGLNKLGFDHRLINLSNTGDPAHVAMPAAHQVASLLKRWLLGTPQARCRSGT
jgi:transposase-like protein